MATEYDPKILQGYAARLYRRAAGHVFVCALLGFLLGFPALAIIYKVLSMTSPPVKVGAGVLAFLLLAGLALGWAYGRGKAFELKLEAQRTLCQVQIEQNTRRAGWVATATPTQAPQPVTCPKCGAPALAGSKFCGDCGCPLPTPTPTAVRASE